MPDDGERGARTHGGIRIRWLAVWTLPADAARRTGADLLQDAVDVVDGAAWVVWVEAWVVEEVKLLPSALSMRTSNSRLVVGVADVWAAVVVAEVVVAAWVAWVVVWAVVWACGEVWAWAGGRVWEWGEGAAWVWACRVGLAR